MILVINMGEHKNTFLSLLKRIAINSTAIFYFEELHFV